MDRLYRNIEDWVQIDELGVDIHFVKENVVVGPQSRLADKFLHGIKVLIAKNYVDNLGEEVRKGMLEKARQGHWPSVAPIGYVNSPVTRRIEPDPERAPIITKLFEWYATGEYSLKALTAKAAAAGLTNRNSGKALVRAKIHQLLQNPIYCGDFQWLDRTYEGQHQPLISRSLFKAVQDAFEAANHPRHTKRQHAFAGLVTCGRCGCAYTAEIKKRQYIYYHCTGYHGACGKHLGEGRGTREASRHSSLFGSKLFTDCSQRGAALLPRRDYEARSRDRALRYRFVDIHRPTVSTGR